MLAGSWAKGGRGGVAIALCVLVGCGARALVESSDDGDEVGAGGRSGTGGVASFAGTGGRGATGGRSGTSSPPPEGCAPGFRRSDDRERACLYLYRGICYENDACACFNACPFDTQCVIDGFLEPDEPQRVRCISQ